MTDTISTPAPRIYVACLASYNSGILHGEWLVAGQPVEALRATVAAVLSGSPIRGPEEWAIHDYEGFGPLRLSEWEPLERVAATAAGIAEHGQAFAAWLNDDSSLDPNDLSAFQEAYLGEWESPRDYAEHYADGTGLYAAADNTGSPYIVVDIDQLTRDLDIELSVVPSTRGTLYLFDR